MGNANSRRLTDLLDKEASAHGFELVLLEVSGPPKNQTVRVFLDHEGGITIDQIAISGRWIREALDALPEFAGGYNLEVSSPGVDRPLVKITDFERFSGSEARISLTSELDGRKNFTGLLLGIEDDMVLLDVDGDTVHIPYGTIKRANLQARLDFAKERTSEDGL